jgi:hypothetical protein
MAPIKIKPTTIMRTINRIANTGNYGESKSFFYSSGSQPSFHVVLQIFCLCYANARLFVLTSSAFLKKQNANELAQK